MRQRVQEIKTLMMLKVLAHATFSKNNSRDADGASTTRACGRERRCIKEEYREYAAERPAQRRRPGQ
jgi:hypothetical protein